MQTKGHAMALLENDAIQGTEERVKTPVHQHVYAQLRDAILFGHFAPGQPLTIQGLTNTIGAGMTPIREALRRLTAEGAVQMLSNRRMTVPVLSRIEAEELLFLRKMLEPELTRRAAPCVSKKDIDDLRDIDTTLNTMIQRGDVTGYLRQNYLFHSRLYARANAPVILATVNGLWLRFGPSLREVCGRIGTANLPDCHAEILDALERRETEAAAAATANDVAQGTHLYLMGRDSIDVG